VTRANLSEQYFTQRQDRYTWLHSAALSEYYAQLIGAVGACSYGLTPAGELALPPGTPNPATQSDAFKVYGK
jgi:hypothetical protein